MGAADQVFLRNISGVIVHDHRGTGQSSKSRIRYSVDQMAADTIGLMDALGHQKAIWSAIRPVWAIGQILCLDHPEKKG